MKRIALISNDDDTCKILNYLLHLDFDFSAENFLNSRDCNFDVIIIDINKMTGQCLEKLLELNIERRIVKIISSVPFIYLPESHKELLRRFESDYHVKPFNLYSFKEELSL